MMKRFRRDRDQNIGPPTRSQENSTVAQVCILHSPKISNDSPFTAFSSLKCSMSDKLTYLLDIRDRRLSEEQNSPNRQEDVCNMLPETLDNLDLDVTGYHRQCYQLFTNHLDRLKHPSASAAKHYSPRKRKSLENDKTFPHDECLFCEKNEIKIGGKTQRPSKTFTAWKNKKSGWENIEHMAEALGNRALYRKVQGVDLFAAEAHYHASCYHRFYSEFHNCNKKSEVEQNDEDTEHSKSVSAHCSAYAAIKEFVQKEIVGNKQVIPLNSIRDKYVIELETKGFSNPDYRSGKLMSKLENDEELQGKIAFSKVSIKDRGCLSIWLVYNAHITTAEAVSFAYKSGTSNQIKDAALYLRKAIEKAFQNSTELPWPPTADELADRAKGEVPIEMKEFLNYVLSGHEPAVESCDKTERLIYSIGEDICRAVTHGKWKLSKHIILCTSVRHLYRSKVLTQILNKLGHCESYDFALDLENSIAMALDENSTLLTPQIICGEGNSVFHSEWDNLNKLTTTIHGSNVVNSAGGIMLQEVQGDAAPSTSRTLPVYDRRKNTRQRIPVPETLPPITIYNRDSPRFPEDASFTHPSDMIYDESLMEYYIWLFCRVNSSTGHQDIPSLAGFISATGVVPKRKSVIDYYAPIDQPITQYETVYELLKRSEKATRDVGQQYTINTFDLGVCMKALPLVWKYPDDFKEHVIIPGPFHTAMNYINMITNHKCTGSGYGEILLEAQLVTSGCLKSVLSGKAYSKAIFCLKTVCEALERLLVEVFIEETSTQIAPPALLELIRSLNRHNLQLCLQDAQTSSIIKLYINYQEKVRKGHLGKTAMFWLSVMDHQKLVMMLIFAVKTNNRKLFHYCNGKMAALFFAYDGPNYSRYLAWFEAFMTNLELTHPGAIDLIDRGALAVARSFIPGSLCAVDKTMEETFMKFAKSSGGLCGIFQMFGPSQRWCRTTSTRVKYFEKLLDICDMVDDPESPKSGKHRDLERANITKSEEAVQRTITTIMSFKNPFRIPVPDDLSDDRLYAIHSGAPVPQPVEMDVLNAEAIGQQKKVEFVDKRLKAGTTGFFEPIKRNKLKTMDNVGRKVVLTTSQGKLIQYQEQSNLAFTLLVKSQMLEDPINLDEILTYSLSLVPHCLGTPDGFFAKTNKASLMHHVLNDRTEEVVYPKDSFFIQDGNALFHSLGGLPPTFGEICLQLLDQMVVKKNFIFSTDSYHIDSIKAQERRRRGMAETFIVDGPSTRRPKDFRLFLCNDKNKVQLCQLLLKVWGSSVAASRLEKCQSAVVVVQDKAYALSSLNGEVTVSEIYSLRSNQEETDTRIVLYLHYAEKCGFKSAVVRTPDSDIFFILLHHAHELSIPIYLDTGTGKHRQLINISDLANDLGQDWTSALLSFFVYTGEDCTSAFKGKGKVAPVRKLEKNPKYHSAFRKIGDTWEITEDTVKEIEAFTCLMYGYPRDSSVNTVRAKMLRKMVGDDQTLTSKSKVDMVRLPPCRNSLIPHLQRVNHRVACYKRAGNAFIERPNAYDGGQGWVRTEDGTIEPLWSKGPILPPSLIDLLEDEDEDDEQEECEDELTNLDYEECLMDIDNENML